MNSTPTDRSHKIEKIIKITKVNLWLEKRWPIFLSIVVLWLGYVCLGLCGVPQQLPDIFRVIVLILLPLISICFCFYKLKQLRPISFKEAIERVEQVNDLPFQPLQTLYDLPADPQTKTIWDQHLQRIHTNLPKLNVGKPRLFYLKNIPNWITAFLLACFVILIFTNGHNTSSRLISTFRPGYDDTTIPLPTIQAWVTPPSYSNTAPIYLQSRNETITTDEKGRLHISLSGLSALPKLTYSSSASILSNVSIKKLENHHWQIEGEIISSGTVSIQARGREVVNFTFNLIKNLPPEITWTGPIANNKYDWNTSFPFKITQQYGIKTATLQIDLKRDNHNTAIHVATIPVAFADHPKLLERTVYNDLSNNIWAGGKAVATLSATDVTGQTTTSKPISFTLPQRKFTSTIAQRLVDIRKDYGRNNISKRETIRLLLGVQETPNAFNDYDIFLNFISIIYSLNYAENNTHYTRSETVDRLWELIMDVEERKNATPEIAKANIGIREAQRSVQEQLEKMQRLGKDKVTREDKAELSRRLDQLQAAIAQKMIALAKQNAQNQPNLSDMKSIRAVSNHSFEELFQQMEKDIDKGDVTQALKRLEQASQVANNMQNATQEDYKKAAEQLQAQQRMKELTQALQDIIKKQQALLDQIYARQKKGKPLPLHSDEDLTELSTPDLLKAIGAQKSQNSDDVVQPIEKSLQSQEMLAHALEALQKQFKEVTKKDFDNLANALKDMQAASQALNQEDDQRAAQFQEKVLIELQKSNQSAQQAMQQAAKQFSTMFPLFSVSQHRGNGSNPGSASEENNKNKDPLGRPAKPEQDTSKVDLTGNTSNARQIEEELRKRSSDFTRPIKELDYINRLLKLF